MTGEAQVRALGYQGTLTAGIGPVDLIMTWGDFFASTRAETELTAARVVTAVAKPKAHPWRGFGRTGTSVPVIFSRCFG